MDLDMASLMLADDHALLREMIAFMRSFPDVWFATGADVAEAWAKLEAEGKV